jgi:hypothetical protein
MLNFMLIIVHWHNYAEIRSRSILHHLQNLPEDQERAWTSLQPPNSR